MLHNSAKYYALIHLNMFDTSNLSHPDSLNITKNSSIMHVIKIGLSRIFCIEGSK